MSVKVYLKLFNLFMQFLKVFINQEVILRKHMGHAA